MIDYEEELDIAALTNPKEEPVEYIEFRFPGIDGVITVRPLDGPTAWLRAFDGCEAIMRVIK